MQTYDGKYALLPFYLVINGGVKFSGFIPDQEEELITDRIIYIDAGV